MGRQRWEQIFRYLTINPRELQPRDPWWAKVEPVSMWIRENCLFAVYPATWFSVDELMVPFHGRS